jgi:hypothetical protein
MQLAELHLQSNYQIPVNLFCGEEFEKASVADAVCVALLFYLCRR